ncbi:hypothetical protein FRAHR75_690005 [Frankia sp. Hr75.2]|nr:hypothetical protein FRAHR75_690005 [Frankia sp. Hr75.2]SQE00164.1 hypothetical protein FMEAI12_6200002 [Parafrankia sp. Ea1.12]
MPGRSSSSARSCPTGPSTPWSSAPPAFRPEPPLRPLPPVEPGYRPGPGSGARRSVIPSRAARATSVPPPTAWSARAPGAASCRRRRAAGRWRPPSAVVRLNRATAPARGYDPAGHRAASDREVARQGAPSKRTRPPEASTRSRIRTARRSSTPLRPPASVAVTLKWTRCSIRAGDIALPAQI